MSAVNIEKGLVTTSPEDPGAPEIRHSHSLFRHMKEGEEKSSLINRIEHGEMKSPEHIVIHQTGGPSAESALNTYENKKDNPQGVGAHFLIDKDGSIYQTARVDQTAYHVGKTKEPHEVTNSNSIGIEIVGDAKKDANGKIVFEPLTPEQEKSAEWLTRGLGKEMDIPMSNVRIHPDVAPKQENEANSARPFVQKLQAEEAAEKAAAAQQASPKNGEMNRMADSFANDTSEEAVKKHPELAGAAATLKAIEKKAEMDNLSPEQQAIVVERARQNIAENIRKTEKLPEMNLVEKHEQAHGATHSQEFSR